MNTVLLDGSVHKVGIGLFYGVIEEEEEEEE